MTEKLVVLIVKILITLLGRSDYDSRYYHAWSARNLELEMEFEKILNDHENTEGR